METRITNCGIEYNDNLQVGKETYVLLHGISSGANSWIKQFENLGDDYRLIAWNAPGYGNSKELSNDKPNAIDYSKALRALCDELKLESIVLVGHSLGALIGAAFVKQNPEIVKRFVMASVARGYAYQTDEFKEKLVQQRRQSLEQSGFLGLYKSRGPALIAQHSEENFQVIHDVMSNLTVRGFTQAAYLLAHDSIHHYMSGLNVTTELVYGDDDGVTTPEMMEELQKEIVFNCVSVVKDAGHLVYLDQPEAFNQAVFLEV